MDITNLKRDPHFINQYVELIEVSFKYEENFSFAQDFSRLLSHDNQSNCWFIVDRTNQLVLATLATKAINLSTSQNILPICLVGGIATRSNNRNQGLFTALLNHIIELNKKNFAFFALWSDQQVLYEKFQFYLSGSIATTIQKAPKKYSPLNFFIRTSLNQLTKSEQADLIKLYNQDRSLKVARSEQDWNEIFNMSSPHLYIYKNENTIEEYYIRGKGFDLQNIVYEYHLRPENILKIAATSVVWPKKCDLVLFNETHEIQLQYLAMFKISNLELIENFIAKEENVCVKLTKTRNFFIQVRLGNHLSEMNPKEFIDLFFGLSCLDNLNTNYPFFISGIDSI